MAYCPDQFVRPILDLGTDSVICTDAHGLTVWANEQFSALSGYKLEDLIGKKPGTLLQGAESCPNTKARISRAIKDGRNITEEILNYHKDGTPYWVELTINPMRNESGDITNFISIERDITRHKDIAHQYLRSADDAISKHRDLKLIGQMSSWLFSAQSMDELVMVVEKSMHHIFPDAGGQIYIYSNSRDCLELKGGWGATVGESEQIRADECWGLRRGKSHTYGGNEICLPCRHAPSHGTAYACLPIVAHGETIGMLHLEFPRIAADVELSNEKLSQLDRKTELAQICVEQISLATAIVRLQAELLDKSVKDALTGLWNRRWFLDMAARELRRANSNRKPLSLVMLDVDHFKKFNDEHGHDAGDTVLKVLSAHLMDIDAEGVFPARFGGEEFAMLCVNSDPKRARQVVEDLRETVGGGQIIHGGHKLPAVTFSAGIAAARPVADLRTLITCADKALYAAKAAGRDQTAIYSDLEEEGRPDLSIVNN